MTYFLIVREIARYDDYDSIVGYDYEPVERTATEDWAVVRARILNAEQGSVEDGIGVYRAMDPVDGTLLLFTSKELQAFEAEHNARTAAVEAENRAARRQAISSV